MGRWRARVSVARTAARAIARAVANALAGLGAVSVVAGGASAQANANANAQANAHATGPRTRDLAGIWVLDVAKSDFGGIPGPSADTAVYVRDGYTYHVKQRVTSPGRSPVLLAIDWPTDSGSAVSTLPGGATMAVHAHVEQGVQVFAAELSQGGQTATESGRVELSVDGRVMTRLQTVIPPAGEPVKIRLVYTLVHDK